MKYLISKNIKLVIVGKGNIDTTQRLESIVRENNLQSKVHFLGQQPFSFIPTLIEKADIGIVPHKSNEHTENTIPHKLFQYMILGTPVLVSSCRPLKRITETHDCGKVFKADDSTDFAEKVIEILESEEKIEKFGKNGINATLNGPLSWDIEGSKLPNVYLNR